MLPDLKYELVKSLSVPTSMLTNDGKLTLRIAAGLTETNVTETNGWSFVQGRNTNHLDGRPLLVFIGRPNRHRPALSNSEVGNCIQICQRYIMQIRLLCLRIWSDASILPKVGIGGSFAFPREPKFDVPFGIETLWLSENTSRVALKDFVPDWYPSAVQQLSRRRHELFRESVAYAVLFTLLHERGHLICRHPEKRDIARHQREMEADAVAVNSLLTMLDSGLLDNKWENVLEPLAVGLSAAFIVFHLIVLHKSPATAGRSYHAGYPTAGERLSQIVREIQRVQLIGGKSGLDYSVQFMRVCNHVAGLHPAFSFVVGTG